MKMSRFKKNKKTVIKQTGLNVLFPVNRVLNYNPGTFDNYLLSGQISKSNLRPRCGIIYLIIIIKVKIQHFIYPIYIYSISVKTQFNNQISYKYMFINRHYK